MLLAPAVPLLAPGRRRHQQPRSRCAGRPQPAQLGSGLRQRTGRSRRSDEDALREQPVTWLQAEARGPRSGVRSQALPGARARTRWQLGRCARVAQVSTCQSPPRWGDPRQAGTWGSYQARGVSERICSRVSVCSRSLADPGSSLRCAGKRLKGGCGPAQRTPGRGAGVSKAAPNATAAPRGQQVPLPSRLHRGSFCLSCTRQTGARWQVLLRLHF